VGVEAGHGGALYDADFSPWAAISDSVALASRDRQREEGPMVTPQAKRRRSRGVRVVVSAGVLAATLLALAAPARAAPQFTPLIATVLAQPAAVEGTDGRIHVVYEVLLQNNESVRVDVLSVAVRTGRGRPLLRVAGNEVPTVMTTSAKQPTASLEASQGGKLWFDLVLQRRRQVPRALVHRISVRATLADGQARTFTFYAARTRVDRRPAVMLAPPLGEGLYLNFNGCCGLSPHRTAIAPVDGVPWLSERFASDFLQIDAQGRGGAGDLSRNESFFTFGDPVHAVAGGRVVSTRNDLPDNRPLMEPTGFTPQTTLGNHVVLRLRGGRFALFAHLERGSVRVRRGERVRTGDVLGRVGNSGQSGGSHLHFQLSDGPDPVASDGVPYTFARFGLLGSVTNVEQFLTGQAPADIRRLEPVQRRRAQLPLQSTVVRFGR
jgi:murein DD-endopeptidase MepM/ murein hydrolase activator NlpD